MAVQMVVETRQWCQPHSLHQLPPSPLLTVGIGNTVMGTVNNNVLWSLALVLLLMSLTFNSVIKLITERKVEKELCTLNEWIKFAAGVLYAISGIIVAILASLIPLYLGPWLAPCILALLDWKSSSYQAGGGGIGIQCIIPSSSWLLP